MRRTLTVVFDEFNEHTNEHGTTYYVSGMFDDDSVVSGGKKTREDAQALRDTLLQLIDIECDYYCDDKGLSKNGRQKWALKAILDVEGGAIYGKVPQGAGVVSSVRQNPQGSAPHLGSTPSRSTDEDIRRAVALKAAANARPGQPADVILDTARIFEGFLSRPLGEEQAGASESSASDSAPAESSAPEANTGEASGSPEPPSTGADRDGGVGLGEGPAPSSTKKGSWEERWAGIEVE